MATAFDSMTVTSSSAILFDASPSGDDRSNVFAFSIHAHAENTVAVQINCPDLHKAGEWVGLRPGQSITLTAEYDTQAIQRINVKSASGTALISGGITGKRA